MYDSEAAVITAVVTTGLPLALMFAARGVYALRRKAAAPRVYTITSLAPRR